jgi:hypothetical protein
MEGGQPAEAKKMTIMTPIQPTVNQIFQRCILNSDCYNPFLFSSRRSRGLKKIASRRFLSSVAAHSTEPCPA